MLGRGKWTWYEHKKPKINMLISILQNRKLRLNKVKATQSQEEPIRKQSGPVCAVPHTTCLPEGEHVPL